MDADGPTIAFECAQRKHRTGDLWGALEHRHDAQLGAIRRTLGRLAVAPQHAVHRDRRPEAWRERRRGAVGAS